MELACTHDLAILNTSLFFFVWLAFSVVCIYFELSFIFLFKRQPQIHALFSWENASNKTVGWEKKKKKGNALQSSG